MRTGRGEGKWKVQRALGNSTRLDLASAGRRTRPTTLAMAQQFGIPICHTACVPPPSPSPTPSSSSPRAAAVFVAATATAAAAAATVAVVVVVAATGVASYHEPAAYLRSLTYKPQPIPVYLARPMDSLHAGAYVRPRCTGVSATRFCVRSWRIPSRGSVARGIRTAFRKKKFLWWRNRFESNERFVDTRPFLSTYRGCYIDYCTRAKET